MLIKKHPSRVDSGVRPPEQPLPLQLEQREPIFEHVVDRADAGPFDSVRQRLRDQVAVADVGRLPGNRQPEIELALGRWIDPEVRRLREYGEVGPIASLQDGVAPDVASARLFTARLGEDQVALAAARRCRAGCAWPWRRPRWRLSCRRRRGPTACRPAPHPKTVRRRSTARPAPASPAPRRCAPTRSTSGRRRIPCARRRRWAGAQRLPSNRRRRTRSNCWNWSRSHS